MKAKLRSSNFINENKISHYKQTITWSKHIASIFPFIKPSATITQQSCNCCTNRRFVYPCSTWCAINFWSCNSALVVRYFVSFHKDVVAWLLLDCCATSLLGTKFLKRNLEAIPYWYMNFSERTNQKAVKEVKRIVIPYDMWIWKTKYMQNLQKRNSSS